jgi:hypothetical protein
MDGAIERQERGLAGNNRVKTSISMLSGDGMVGLNCDTALTKELEIQIKLHINESLFLQGLITEDMYARAKSIIMAA